MKRCPGCATLKPLTEFSKNKRKPDGLQTSCKACAKQRNASWYASNQQTRVDQNRYQRNRNNLFIVAISIGFGMIPLIAPNFKQWMPHAIHPLIESGILLASISAVVLNLYFNGARGDANEAVQAAKLSEAH